MTSIEFYYDPSCPFSWITSRWLLQVSEYRELDISWRQFSLALKNDELTQRDDDSKYTIAHRGSHRVQRVIRSAVDNHNASQINLYSEFGIRHHIMEQTFDDDMILAVLAEKDLPAELLQAADDESIDAALQLEIDSATEAAGNDIGVPTIIFRDKDGSRIGYFGPVLNELPASIDESLAIWDGLAMIATTSSFYELKRNRPGDPNVFSAAKC